MTTDTVTQEKDSTPRHIDASGVVISEWEHKMNEMMG